MRIINQTSAHGNNYYNGKLQSQYVAKCKDCGEVLAKTSALPTYNMLVSCSCGKNEEITPEDFEKEGEESV